MNHTNHRASVWGNAVSVAENRPERYARDITIRYGINMPFSGTAIRLTFDNYCGTEPITLTKVTAFHGGEFYPVHFGGERSVTIGAKIPSPGGTPQGGLSCPTGNSPSGGPEGVGRGMRAEM